jgi:hypothetical protein
MEAVLLGPKTPEGLERSQKARWKHGQRSAKVRAARRERAAALAWTRRFVNLLPNVDRLFQLLDEIACQVDTNDSTQLTAKFVTALKSWREYQSLLSSMPHDKRKRERQSRVPREDRFVTLMLEAAPRVMGGMRFRRN